MKESPMTPDEKKLMDYLQGHMSDEEKRAFEAAQQEDHFVADASEGLSAISSESILSMQQELNKNLQQQLNRKKRKKRKPVFSNPFYFYIALAIIMLLAIIGYLVIKKLTQ